MDKAPMKIDEVMDDVILLVLDGHEPLKELGIEKNKIYVKVVGYDEYGLWVEHPAATHTISCFSHTERRGLRWATHPSSTLHSVLSSARGEQTISFIPFTGPLLNCFRCENRYCPVATCLNRTMLSRSQGPPQPAA